MQKKIRAFMEEYHMVEEGDCILAAVSGGADSLCLVLVLLALRLELGIRLCAVHVEHGIRGAQSVRDAEFVAGFCRQHQIPYKMYRCHAKEYAKTHGQTVEEAARELRYQFFYHAAQELGADKIAVAHNQNDCAETMIFHLVRGTGLKGLCGIPPVRGKIIRPLLCAARQEIEGYLAGKKQEFCTDQTNEELIYSRNKIRHQVIPILSQVNDQAVSHISQVATFAMEAVELLEDLAGQAQEKYVFENDMGVCIRQELLQESPAIQRNVLHNVLAGTAKSSKDILKIHVQQVRELFDRQNGKQAALPYDLEAERIYEGVLLRNTKENKKKPCHIDTVGADSTQRSWELPNTGNFSILSHGYQISTRLLHKIPQNEEIPKKLYTKWFDYDKIKGTMRLRTRQEQDYLVIDTQGRRKKLKKYFIDEKVPKEKRDQILLLADESHILWVIGHRISEDIKVTEDTKRILEVRISGGSLYE